MRCLNRSSSRPIAESSFSRAVVPPLFGRYITKPYRQPRVPVVGVFPFFHGHRSLLAEHIGHRKLVATETLEHDRERSSPLLLLDSHRQRFRYHQRAFTCVSVICLHP